MDSGRLLGIASLTQSWREIFEINLPYRRRLPPNASKDNVDVNSGTAGIIQNKHSNSTPSSVVVSVIPRVAIATLVAAIIVMPSFTGSIIIAFSPPGTPAARSVASRGLIRLTLVGSAPHLLPVENHAIVVFTMMLIGNPILAFLLQA